ncbi:MAG: rhomboid family intramembrane serine protease [Desulfobacula sp.]|nr:rhomboid family intramembrane serine protease [Desulfobacula sp.]
MNNKPNPFYSNLSSKKADLIVLILTSQHIQTQVERRNSIFDIFVKENDIKKAHDATEAYFKENKPNTILQQLEQIPLSSFKSVTTFYIIGLMVLIHYLSHTYRVHDQIILQYGSSALYILQGETYRAITALFLHADSRHLLGNMAGMILFAAPVISISGFGTGPFILLFSATFGNLLNAYLYRTAHLSIGASTAVMAAAGLLAAFQFTHKFKPIRLNSLMPVFSGAILVGLFSHGERTDTWAHIFGFISGLLSGIFFFPLDRTFDFKYKNILFLALTIIIFLSALIAGQF